MNAEVPIFDVIGRLSLMKRCTLRMVTAVFASRDEDTRWARRLKFSCAATLSMLKHKREHAITNTLYLLLNTRWFDAKDPRDKVFALVGLTNDIGKSFVDYSKSHEDVMRELNSMLLDGRVNSTEGSVLDVWSLHTREEYGEITEPSWVVDFSKLPNSIYRPMTLAYPPLRSEVERKPKIQELVSSS